ncbi:acyl-ACP--UDP-N-acetylglucosamine O-acyltransferase [bacterium]|nr:acyl-ACP--UDP-N-acetylglucosamine O-acyltransferase [bacterium]
MRIHKTAIIHEHAELEEGVTIGPYSMIGPGVHIGPHTEIGSHVVIECNTRIGAHCRIKTSAVLGSDAQDLSYKGEPAFLEIGDRNTFGEFVMISRGAHDERITRIGNDNLIMSGVHVAHDCRLGNHIIMSNYVQLAGHIQIEDRAVIGGMAAVRQFVRIGTLSMIGGTAGVMQDVPPYCMVQGAPPATVRGLNRIGLVRNGVSEEGLTALKHSYRLMFRRSMPRNEALDEIERLVELTPEVKHFVEFCRNPSKTGICKPEPSSGLGVVGGAGGSLSAKPALRTEDPPGQTAQG